MTISELRDYIQHLDGVHPRSRDIDYYVLARAAARIRTGLEDPDAVEREVFDAVSAVHPAGRYWAIGPGVPVAVPASARGVSYSDGGFDISSAAADGAALIDAGIGYVDPDGIGWPSLADRPAS